jgi:intracellular multiplication protein IcmD
MKFRNYHFVKGVVAAMLAVGCFYVSFAFAQGEGLGGMAELVTSTLTDFAKLVTALSYLAGLIFAVLSILKFKAYRDNPAQVSIGVPIVLLLVAVGLLFLPALFEQAGKTLGLEEAGTISGVTEI